MAAGREHLHQMLRALHGPMPVHHGQNDDVREMILARKEGFGVWT
jgi:hypothetical protein